jgi:hypothetical protein
MHQLAALKELQVRNARKYVWVEIKSEDGGDVRFS